MAVQAMRTRNVILFFVAASAAQAEPDFRQLIHQGQEALAKSDIAVAAGLFSQACGEHPETFSADRHASCEHHLAIVDQARGDLARAEAHMRSALAAWQEAGD